MSPGITRKNIEKVTSGEANHGLPNRGISNPQMRWNSVDQSGRKPLLLHQLGQQSSPWRHQKDQHRILCCVGLHTGAKQARGISQIDPDVGIWSPRYPIRCGNKHHQRLVGERASKFLETNQRLQIVQAADGDSPAQQNVRTAGYEQKKTETKHWSPHWTCDPKRSLAKTRPYRKSRMPLLREREQGQLTHPVVVPRSLVKDTDSGAACSLNLELL